MMMSSKPHNPTPAERDERFSLYGLDPEKAVETVLGVKVEEEKPKPHGRHRATPERSEGK